MKLDDIFKDVRFRETWDMTDTYYKDSVDWGSEMECHFPIDLYFKGIKNPITIIVCVRKHKDGHKEYVPIEWKTEERLTSYDPKELQDFCSKHTLNLRRVINNVKRSSKYFLKNKYVTSKLNTLIEF